MNRQDFILQADRLCYTYEGESKPALNQLSLQIRRGKKIACMGANGSGKSTFFLCCNGIRKPDSGKIHFNSQPLDYSKQGLLHLRRKVGIVFQDPDRQLFSASVFQEISFGLLNLGFPEEEARKKVSAIIEELGISSFAHKPTHALSDGQKKLVSIADILVMEPELMILDEPASTLDPLHTQMVRDLIDRIVEKGITVMMATHDVNYAYSWADEILLFHQGQVIGQGRPVQIFSDKELMQKTCLTPPTLLTVFETLQSGGLVSSALPAPRDLGNLQEILASLCLRN